MLFKQFYKSPLGDMILVSDSTHLVGLFFEDQPPVMDPDVVDKAQLSVTEPIMRASAWLDAYFAGRRPDVNQVPIMPDLTPFRTKVTGELQQVPYGQTTTYRQLSDQLQTDVLHPQNKSRAVGGAVGHNPILLLVPCHRVIGQDGSLTGYSAGLARKEWLLNFEQE